MWYQILKFSNNFCSASRVSTMINSVFLGIGSKGDGLILISFPVFIASTLAPVLTRNCRSMSDFPTIVGGASTFLAYSPSIIVYILPWLR